MQINKRGFQNSVFHKRNLIFFSMECTFTYWMYSVDLSRYQFVGSLQIQSPSMLQESPRCPPPWQMIRQATRPTSLLHNSTKWDENNNISSEYIKSERSKIEKDSTESLFDFHRLLMNISYVKWRLEWMKWHKQSKQRRCTKWTV